MSVDGRLDSGAEGGLAEPTELEPEQGSLELASADDRHDRAAWEAAAAAVLRKAGRMADDDPDSLVWDELAHTTLDDLPITPLGTAEQLADVRTAGRPTRAGDWDVRVPLGRADAKALNGSALVDLENGATSLWLEADADLDLATALDGVMLDVAPVVLDSAEPLPAAEALVALARDRQVTLHPDTNLGADPLGDTVRGGGRPAAEQFQSVASLALDTGVRGAVVDATAVHDLGSSDAQELGYSLAVGVAYLRGLTDAGIPVDDALGLLEFRYAATDEQFPTIAKLRAARRLWRRVAELCEAGVGEQRQHAVTSRPMMSKYDPYVNMVRTTVAAFAAGTGGADAVTVLPFDSPLGQPEAFGRRIARNTNALLMHESQVALVADPAGGSYAVEKLTDDLAVAAWEEFGRIEEAGGIEAALGDGSLRTRIDEVAARRERDVSTRTRPITGLSEFPNPAEVLPEREPVATGSILGGADVRRYGASFEALRDEPAPRTVFLATLGTVAQHTARATFATNLFAAGGIKVVPAGVTDGVDDVVSAYHEAPGPVVCLAGDDPSYAEWGSEAVAALRDAGAQHVIVAGKPDAVDGADDSCATGVDALAFLTRTRLVLSRERSERVEGEKLA